MKNGTEGGVRTRMDYPTDFKSVASANSATPAPEYMKILELTGIEPATYSLQSYRSSQLSYSPIRTNEI